MSGGNLGVVFAEFGMEKNRQVEVTI